MHDGGNLKFQRRVFLSGVEITQGCFEMEPKYLYVENWNLLRDGGNLFLD